MTTAFSLSRVFEAPRSLVFDCLTQPEHLACFWGPTGTTTPIEHITVDLRVGGVFETVMVNDSDGSQYATHWVYTEVDPPVTLAWRDVDNGMTSTTTFVELEGGRTEVRIDYTNAPDAVATPEARRGFGTSLDRLDAHLAAIR